MKLASSAAERAFATDYLNFINKSPSHFHAVQSFKERLTSAGYKCISEKDSHAFTDIVPGGKYLFTRNQSTLIAFAVGAKWERGNGFNIMGAHTDSPVLKVKPISKIEKHGFLQVGVECYGGGLWYTWFDRDLSLAGRVMVENEDGSGFTSTLVQISRPILRIPSLAIHLNREVGTDGFNPNKETHTVPILASVIKEQLSLGQDSKGKAIAGEHHPLLISLLAEEMKVDAGRIRDFELSLFDCNPACLIGAHEEFISSRALDNLMMSFVTMRALIDSDNSLQDETQIRVVGLFDHEECGSQSSMGAGSNLMSRILLQLNQDPVSYDAAIRKSFLMSCDMAHGVHPNYPEKHEERHRPSIHGGLVVKQNANQRYATSGISAFLVNEIAKRHNIPLQKFVVRNDVMCGSTIGPILSSSLGIRTIDVGIPQLSMHSIREMCGTADCLSAYELCKAFFADFARLDKTLANID